MCGPMTSPILGNFIYVNEKKIGVCGDPAHLMKSHVQAMLHINYLHVSGTERDERQVRMTLGEIYQQELNLVTPDISIVPVRALCDWQDEHEIVLCDRISHKVLEAAADPFGKMNVRNALAILNKDVASAITFLVENHNFPVEYLTTAWHIYVLAEWFEIVAARNPCMAFDRQKPEKREAMRQFLIAFIPYICNVKFKGNQLSINTNQKGMAATSKTVLWLDETLLREDPTIRFFPAGRCSLCDRVENHHFAIRDFNKNPTCRQCKSYQKATMICQNLKTKKKKTGHNYEDDDRTETLLDFSMWKQAVKDQEAIADEDEEDLVEFKQYCIENSFDPRVFHSGDQFSEANGLSNYIGYCLKKKTKVTKCKLCIEKYILPKGAKNDDPLNTLIVTKMAFSTLPYVNPTVLANDIFHDAEALFRENRDLYIREKDMDKKLKAHILTQLVTKYGSKMPKCGHFEKILDLFLRGRWHFYANYLNRFGYKANEEEILQGAAHASKSTAAKVILK